MNKTNAGINFGLLTSPGNHWLLHRNVCPVPGLLHNRKCPGAGPMNDDVPGARSMNDDVPGAGHLHQLAFKYEIVNTVIWARGPGKAQKTQNAILYCLFALTP